ncbi:acyl-CoA dehydrogenase family protein [Flavisphingomonas formosensis]|uniref:acyl-CoA dehydrogenase family protein n=1 Tax=Flavisphingomonas formosensis TaxID=861534 RepID=UPI0012FB6423|nr:acyl-CoA dehydrogenase family protein [Sphingomonas formosensis]
MSNDLLEPFQRLLDDVSPPEAVRRTENEDGAPAIWAALRDSGFVDALVSEEHGGAGLSPAEMAPLLIAAGRHLLPLPFGETMAARAIAAGAGHRLEDAGPVLLWPLDREGRARSIVPPIRGGADLALVQQAGRATLRRVVAGGRDGFGFVTAALDTGSAPIASFELAEDSLLYWAAALTVAAMAGAMAGVLDMSIAYVNERQQFGRPLGKFQAIQQQISVMAERVAMASVAAQGVLARPLPGPAALDVAVAKPVIDAGASIVCAAGHAAFGAIGITAEHDLSLFTRRLKRGLLAFGGAQPWAKALGRARLAQAGGTSVDFIRALQHG